MDIRKPKIRPGATVVLLAAGASYGPCVAKPPPIMRDFISVGRRMQVKADYTGVWEFLNALGYDDSALEAGSPNLEDVYSIMHIVSSGLWYKSESDYMDDLGKWFWSVVPVDVFESFIVEVLDNVSTSVTANTCRLHDALVAQLEPGDAFVSFNYDLIIDASICKTGVWSEFDGYGFLCLPLLDELKVDYRDYLVNRQVSEIILLKPHGSLNWELVHPWQQAQIGPPEESTKAVVRQSLHERVTRRYGIGSKIHIRPLAKIKKEGKSYQGVLQSMFADFMDIIADSTSPDKRWKLPDLSREERKIFIVPPSLYKFSGSGMVSNLAEVWTQMRTAISCAGRLLCIGYSFPTTDLHFSTLFRMACRENIADHLVIELVNPDPTVFERVCALAPCAEVRVVAKTLRDYVNKGL